MIYKLPTQRVVCHSGALISAEAVPHVEAREAPELTDPGPHHAFGYVAHSRRESQPIGRDDSLDRVT